MGIVQYSGYPWLRLPFSQGTSNQAVAAAIKGLYADSPGGGTATSSGLRIGCEQLASSTRTYAPKVLILITDGIANVLPNRTGLKNSLSIYPSEWVGFQSNPSFAWDAGKTPGFVDTCYMGYNHCNLDNIYASDTTAGRASCAGDSNGNEIPDTWEGATCTCTCDPNYSNDALGLYGPNKLSYKCSQSASNKAACLNYCCNTGANTGDNNINLFKNFPNIDYYVNITAIGTAPQCSTMMAVCQSDLIGAVQYCKKLLGDDVYMYAVGVGLAKTANAALEIIAKNRYYDLSSFGSVTVQGVSRPFWEQLAYNPIQTLTTTNYNYYNWKPPISSTRPYPDRVLAVTNWQALSNFVLSITSAVCDINAQPCGNCCGFCLCGACNKPETCNQTSNFCDVGAFTTSGTCCQTTTRTSNDCDAILGNTNKCKLSFCNRTSQACETTDKQCPATNGCYSYACRSTDGACVQSPIFTQNTNKCLVKKCNETTFTTYDDPVVCTNSNPCVTVACDPSTGQCVSTNKPLPTDSNKCNSYTCDPSSTNTAYPFVMTTKQCYNNTNQGKCESYGCNATTGQCYSNVKTCNDPANLCDTSYCAPASGSCVSQTKSCTNPDLCQNFFKCDTATGTCLYNQTQCSKNSCFNVACNSTSGKCYNLTTGCENICQSATCFTQNDVCFNYACNQTTATVTGRTNCDIVTNVTSQNCKRQLTDTCVIPNGCSNGQCQYIDVVCTPPANQCLAVRKNTTYPGCCEVYDPVKCPQTDPCLVPSCNTANGQCTYTPLALPTYANKCITAKCNSSDPSNPIYNESKVCPAATNNCYNAGCNTTTGVCYNDYKVCNDPTNKCDTTTCDLVLGYSQCPAKTYKSCPANEGTNLCRILDKCDTATGNCVYKDKVCVRTNCSNVACNSSTGNCEDLKTGCEGLCSTSNCSSLNNACFTYACNSTLATETTTANCAIVTPTVCNRHLTDKCITNPTCDNVTGCHYDDVPCPPSPFKCLAVLKNSSVDGCCVYYDANLCPNNDPCVTKTCNNGTGACDVVVKALPAESNKCISWFCNSSSTNASFPFYSVTKQCPAATNKCYNAGCDPATGNCYNDAIICNDPTNLCELTTCDLATGTCPPKTYVDCGLGRNGDLCQPSLGCDNSTGKCNYGVKTCTKNSCFDVTCDSATGNCKNLTTGCENICQAAQCDLKDNACFKYACNQTKASVTGETNCDIVIPVVCNQTDFCQTPNGCDNNTGCLTVPVVCPPPTNLCMAVKRNSSNPVCCETYDPEKCKSSDPCSIGSCDPASGQCSFTPKCGVSTLCTIFSCDPVTADCSSSNVTCTPPNKCFLESVCSEVDGCVFTAKSCDDNNTCTVDTCDIETGVCSNVPVVCDDKDACTVDTCVDGQCVSTPKNCDDNNLCTIDSCDTTLGCINAPFTREEETAFCNDDNQCTTDTCNSQTNQCDHQDISNSCTSDDPCLIPTCNPGLGCITRPLSCSVSILDNPDRDSAYKSLYHVYRDGLEIFQANSSTNGPVVALLSLAVKKFQGKTLEQLTDPLSSETLAEFYSSVRILAENITKYAGVDISSYKFYSGSSVWPLADDCSTPVCYFGSCAILIQSCTNNYLTEIAVGASLGAGVIAGIIIAAIAACAGGSTATYFGYQHFTDNNLMNIQNNPLFQSGGTSGDNPLFEGGDGSH
eukprot:TRINITY_DN10305_c0_g1_i1.p1 TRINITY_DN10305_c0_g1~~TRINITY_DN10305_c0_g1_i1.p1  ORF type:complete len:1933 (+),score=488.24 TRINITY_DN10305_c0_g1_i1:791-5800(+)